MNHFMADIETMGNQPDAPLVSIGVVAFDPVTRTIGRDFRVGVRLGDSVRQGARLDAGTVLWWLEQSQDAQAALLADQKHALLEEPALHAFSQWLAEVEPDKKARRLWGNGATFDNVILDAAYRRNNVGAPWGYSQHRCYRTLRNLAREIEVPREGVHHDPLDDARHQVRTLFAVMDYLGLRDLE